MEIYAAMVENTDYHLGRVLNHLKAAGKLDNTIVVVMSDNGAEPTELLALAASVDPKMKQWIEENWDTRPESWGRPGSVADYGMAWAQVGSGPFRNFKHYVAEGGIRVPLIVAGPGVANGTSNASLMHVTDIVPTLLQLANLKHPSIDEPKLAPVIGKSLVPVLSGNAASVRTDEDWIGWELFGNRAIRKGDWKLLSILKEAGGTGDWQLFNLKQDPGETNDLTSSHPEKRAELLAHWDQYVKDNGVIVTGDGPFKKPKSIEGETD
jgi:arylsulfatase